MAVFQLLSDIALATKITADTPSGGVTQGAFQSVGSVYGFAFTTVPAVTNTIGLEGNYESTTEQQYTLIVQADKVLAAKGSGALSQGALLYYDATGAVVTTESTGNAAIGWVTTAAASSDTTVEIKFNGEQPL